MTIAVHPMNLGSKAPGDRGSGTRQDTVSRMGTLETQKLHLKGILRIVFDNYAFGTCLGTNLKNDFNKSAKSYI